MASDLHGIRVVTKETNLSQLPCQESPRSETEYIGGKGWGCGGRWGGGGGREWIMATGVVVGRGAWSHLREVSEEENLREISTCLVILRVTSSMPGHSQGDGVSACPG